jgi:predicted DNA-binding WGR domain protein
MTTDTRLEKASVFKAYARFVSVDSTTNRFRFYSLTWQPSLWGGGVLTRSWGRIGGRGRSLATSHTNREDAQELVDQIVRRREQHGYQVVDVH